MDISPETSLHECLYGMGDVSLGQALAEFNSDLEKTRQCVTAFIGSGWAVLFERCGEEEIQVADHQCNYMLSKPEFWQPCDERTCRVFLRVTDAGARAFIEETNFFDELDKEFYKHATRKKWNTKSRRKRG